jgi:hypothetical protein
MKTMEIGNLFITATKNRYRYPYKGLITTEDLWSLPLTELDAIYKNLKSELKEYDAEDSLLGNSDDAAVTITNNQIEIVKYIVKDKLDAADRRKKAAENAAKRQRIMELIADKEDSALMDKTADELREMLEDLK